MASSTSSGSTLLFTSCSEGDDFNQQNQGTDDPTTNPADQRRQKRMLSNRESARRSRMRKQKHLDDLTAEVIRLRTEKDRLMATLKSATQQYHALESDNSVMRAQAAELATWLESFSEILSYMDLEQQSFSYGDDCVMSSHDDGGDVKPRAAADQGFTPCPWIWNWNTQQLQPSIMGIVSAAAAAGAGAPPAFPMAAADMLLY